DLLQFYVQLRRPLSFKFLPRQRQTFIGGFGVAQCGPGQHDTENGGRNGSNQRNVGHDQLKRNAVLAEPLQVHGGGTSFLVSRLPGNSTDLNREGELRKSSEAGVRRTMPKVWVKLRRTD